LGEGKKRDRRIRRMNSETGRVMDSREIEIFKS
jgi:hypothetical protein